MLGINSKMELFERVLSVMLCICHMFRDAGMGLEGVVWCFVRFVEIPYAILNMNYILQLKS